MRRLLFLVLLLALAKPCVGQVAAGPFTGVFDRGKGGHPHLYLALGGRLELRVAGLAWLGAEALIVPAEVGGRKVDLFSYRAFVRGELLPGDVRPFLVMGAGWSQWRTWVCGGTSCAEEPGAGQRFSYDKGWSATYGAGVRLRSVGPVWLRAELRRESQMFPAPVTDGWLVTLGVELEP